MKTLLIVLFSLMQLTASAQTNSLVIKSGETKTLSARTYQFESVKIENGGNLIIRSNSSRWCIIWVSGDVEINGEIKGTNFRRNQIAISDITPDGKKIEHKFSNVALGGSGGNGGVASQLGAGSRSGGTGASGTSEYGGGGGSGGGIHIQGHATRLGANGNNASDFRGAIAPDGGYGNSGGNGSRLSTYPNGALLLIYSEKTISGNGIISLKGVNGGNGASGGRGANSNRGKRGAGGGGGGSPGGDGGRLVLIAEKFQEDLTIALDGGNGGSGGPAGNPANYATGGSKGEDGETGIVDFYTLDQWKNAAQLVNVKN